MTVTKIKAGVYKVTLGIKTLILRGGSNYNSDSKFYRNGGYEVWDADSEENCNDSNCWACAAPSKKVALEWIKEQEASVS